MDNDFSGSDGVDDRGAGTGPEGCWEGEDDTGGIASVAPSAAFSVLSLRPSSTGDGVAGVAGVAWASGVAASKEPNDNSWIL